MALISFRCCACTLTLVLSAPALAADRAPAGGASAGWEALARAMDHLAGGEPGKARREARWAIFEARGATEAEQWGLLAAAQRTLALAALAGADEEAALWCFHLAAVLEARAERQVNPPPGLGADELESRLRRALAAERQQLDASARLPEPPGGSPFVPPAVRKRRPLALPPGAISSQGPPQVMVRVLVDPSGRPRAPEVLFASVGPLAVQAALESLAGWRFAPARLAGRPLPFLVIVEIKP